MLGEGITDVDFHGISTLNFTESMVAAQPKPAIATYRSRQIDPTLNKKASKP